MPSAQPRFAVARPVPASGRMRCLGPLRLWLKNKKTRGTRRTITMSREEPKMTPQSPTQSAGVTRRRFAVGVGAAGLLAGTAPFNRARAQSGPLKVGVLLPRSGAQAGIGQD